MRAAVVAALSLLLGSAVASADPKLAPPWGGVHRLPAGTKPFTSVSHVLYLNDCLPNGCTVHPGGDDSRTDQSSIADHQVTLPGYGYGTAKWNELVQCVKDTYAPFDIQVTTTDPGTAPHSEVMIGGHALDLNSQLQGAGGVAPFISCGATDDNTISFVFSAEVNNLNFLCGAVAQESMHVWGLDHELDAKDPMTYLDLGSHKTFQDNNANCGENTPRDCNCGGPTQNSVRYLYDTFGPANLTPPAMTITAPADGAWVKPGFTVKANAMSQLSVASATLSIDGTAGQMISAAAPGPLTFTAPTAIPGGDHTVKVSAVDAGSRMFDASVAVKVTPACGAGNSCPKDLHCLGGLCYPGQDVAGGLGATCTDNEACVTGTCGSDGAHMLCTDACDAGNKCPSGYDCLTTSAGTGVCWPGAPDSSGCTTSGGGSPALALLGLGGLVIALRRRR